MQIKRVELRHKWLIRVLFGSGRDDEWGVVIGCRRCLAGGCWAIGQEGNVMRERE